MLAYVLALVVGLGSFALYMAAFFFPEVHRKSDFIWSGVGLFYALVLWVCAGRITGGLLLGQTASIALLGWFGWQTLTLRRSQASPEQQTPVPSQGELTEKFKNISSDGGVQGLLSPITGFFKNRLGQRPPQAQTTQTPVEPKVSSPAVTVVDARTTQTAPAEAKDAAPVEGTEPTTPTPEITEEKQTAGVSEIESPQLVRPNPPDPELLEAAKNSTPSEEEVSERIEILSEEVPPEAALAPPAEPIGSGDPADRQVQAPSE